MNCGIIQNAVALLCNLSGDTVLDLEPVNQQGTLCLYTDCTQRVEIELFFFFFKELNCILSQTNTVMTDWVMLALKGCVC